MSKIVSSFLDGTNETIFVFGQSGSGKTFTIFGQHEEGILFLALEQIVKDRPIMCSYSQISNEKSAVLDSLVAPSEIKTFEDAKLYIKNGEKKRARGVTTANKKSSRTHVFFKITLNDATLSFIDLAGSESTDTCRSEGTKVSMQINESLLALGKMMRSGVPSRDTALTRVLGNRICNTTVILCVSPSEGTLSTAEFGLALKRKNCRPANARALRGTTRKEKNGIGRHEKNCSIALLTTDVSILPAGRTIKMSNDVLRTTLAMEIPECAPKVFAAELLIGMLLIYVLLLGLL